MRCSNNSRLLFTILAVCMVHHYFSGKLIHRNAAQAVGVEEEGSNPLFLPYLAGLYCNKPSEDINALDIILVTFGNSAYVPFVQNWLCNTVVFPGVHDRTLVINDNRDIIQQFVQHRKPIFCFDSKITLSSTAYHFGTRGYWELVQRRVQIVQELVSSSRSLLVFEPDAFWVQNALQDAELMSATEDFVGFIDNKLFGFGWMRLSGTTPTRMLMQELRRRFDMEMNAQQGLDKMQDIHVKLEQSVLTDLLNNRHLYPGFANITVKLLPECLYVCGLWYDGGKSNDGGRLRKTCQRKGLPVVINNNWIVGNLAKVSRAKRWGHWFIQNDTLGTCDSIPTLTAGLSTAVSTVQRGRPLHGPPLASECPLC